MAVGFFTIHGNQIHGDSPFFTIDISMDDDPPNIHVFHVYIPCIVYSMVSISTKHPCFHRMMINHWLLKMFLDHFLRLSAISAIPSPSVQSFFPGSSTTNNGCHTTASSGIRKVDLTAQRQSMVHVFQKWLCLNLPIEMVISIVMLVYQRVYNYYVIVYE